MSYQQNSRITQFVQGYVPHSDFFNKPVLEVSEADRIQMLNDLQEDRRRGNVLTQRPPQFNPARYVSYQVYENVNVNQVIPPERIQQIIQSNSRRL